MANDETDHTPAGDDRRKDDRRKTQEPMDGADRRKGQRRSGGDRRATPRS
jgi:hypothetical protein